MDADFNFFIETNGNLFRMLEPIEWLPDLKINDGGLHFDFDLAGRGANFAVAFLGVEGDKFEFCVVDFAFEWLLESIPLVQVDVS